MIFIFKLNVNLVKFSSKEEESEEIPEVDWEVEPEFDPVVVENL